jgi:type VI secretion system protein ImpA
LKEADWKLVGTRCAELIEARSKDLRLAVWLAEASAKTRGMHALGDCLLLIAALCERYWEQVFPLPDENGFEQRIGNLCWITARLPPLLLDMPISEGVGTAYSINHVEAARVRPGSDPDDGAAAIDAARRRSSRAFYAALLSDAAHCMDGIGELERVVDDRLGADGPGLSAARSALQDLVHAVMPFAREAGALTELQGQGQQHLAAKMDGQGGEGTLVTMPQVQQGDMPGPLKTRAQALAQLRSVAEFFRSTEPHSPVAYLADKAAAWGEQPLHVWLRGVVKDRAMREQLEELLGVESSAQPLP